MELGQARVGDVTVLSVAGRVDHANAEQFRLAMFENLGVDRDQKSKIVLDLSQLEYISSAGLRVLMLTARRVKLQEGEAVVAAMQPVVQEVFEITRFNLVFKVFDSVDAAVTALGGDAAPPPAS